MAITMKIARYLTPCKKCKNLKYLIVSLLKYLIIIEYEYESGAFSETDFPVVFFFLPPTDDRIKKINLYFDSVRLNPTDIEISKFGEKFGPSKLDYNNSDKENTRQSVLRVLKKVADMSSQKLRRNADGYLTRVPHNNDPFLRPGGKPTHGDRFCLSY